MAKAIFVQLQHFSPSVVHLLRQFTHFNRSHDNYQIFKTQCLTSILSSAERLNIICKRFSPELTALRAVPKSRRASCRRKARGHRYEPSFVIRSQVFRSRDIGAADIFNM